MSKVEVQLVARNATIGELVQACADGKLPFSGPDSLWSKVSAMGYNCGSLYYMVQAAADAMKEEPDNAGK